MKFKKTIFALLFAGIITLFSSSVSFAQDAMMKDTMMKDDRPIVAVIKADWCPYCKKVDPVVAGLKQDYSEKFKFVVFDVTNAETSAASKEKAASLGLSEFFEAYKKKTSAVAVLKDKKVVYKTFNNTKRDDYVKAFDAALN